MIYYDPTESRPNTRLSPAVINAGQPVQGLEQATGADILISREGLPDDVRKPPGKILLPRFTENAFLVQRKSGMDFLNSIREPGLSSILFRMKQHNALPWLLIVGSFERAYRTGKMVVDGRATDWNPQSFQGAIDAWQLEGGSVVQVENEQYAKDWIFRWDENLPRLQKSNEIFVKAKKEMVHLKLDPRPWKAVLEAFNGVGSEKSAAIAEKCDNLAYSLMWMSMPEETIEGIGQKTKENWRIQMGLTEDQVLCVVQDRKVRIPEWLKEQFKK